jgi:hypothetical protein
MNLDPTTRRNLTLWLAFMVCYEVLGGFAYALHAGYLGAFVPGATGPVSVLVVEKSRERTKLTSGQLYAMTSNADDGLLAYLKTHGEDDPFRLLDQDDGKPDEKGNIPIKEDTPKVQAEFAAKGNSVPWLIVSRSGRVLLSEVMPSDLPDIMRAVRRYGGQ